MLEYLKVFSFGLIIDLAYVLYIIAVTNDRYITAGVATAAVAAPGLFGYMAVYDNKILAIPYLLGLCVGTIVGMMLKKRMTQK